jgi:hypothetical protein
VPVAYAELLLHPPSLVHLLCLSWPGECLPSVPLLCRGHLLVVSSNLMSGGPPLLSSPFKDSSPCFGAGLRYVELGCAAKGVAFSLNRGRRLRRALVGVFLTTFSPLSIVLHHREWLWISATTRGWCGCTIIVVRRLVCCSAVAFFGYWWLSYRWCHGLPVTIGIRFFAERRRLCREFFFGHSAKNALPRAK